MRLLVFLLVLVGCSEIGPPQEIRPVPTEPLTAETLVDARATWDALNADDYSFALQRACFCDPDWLGPFEVHVEAGEVVSVTRGGERVPTDRALTIDGLLDLLQDALDRDAESIGAAFDPTTGAPLTLFIDYDIRVADEEVGFYLDRIDLD